MNVKKIKLADIDPRIDGRIRPVDKSHAAIIAQAFEERGQETAIVVRYGSGAEDAPKYILVSGAHRLRAAELVGWDSIDASITKLNADEARLQEIDENLIRQELDVLSRARCLYERKELYLKLHPETKLGVNQHSAIETVANPAPRFALDAAARMGVSERTVHGYVSLYKNLQPEVVKILQTTTLADDRQELLYIGSIQEPVLQVAKVKEAIFKGKKPSELKEGPVQLSGEALWQQAGKKEATRFLKMEVPARRVFLDELVKAGVIRRDQIVEAA